jgi:hypothetical protein
MMTSGRSISAYQRPSGSLRDASMRPALRDSTAPADPRGGLLQSLLSSSPEKACLRIGLLGFQSFQSGLCTEGERVDLAFVLRVFLYEQIHNACNFIFVAAGIDE